MNDVESLYRIWDHQISELSDCYQGVILGLSGGLDSTVLFRLFCDYFKEKKNFKFSVAHLNYRLRGQESEDNQSFVEQISSEACVPAKVLRVSDEQLKTLQNSSTQETARTIRYEFFSECAKGQHLIATAHNLNDLAETSLFRMARGSSPGNLGGMHTWAPPMWRPLLGIQREELENYAKKIGMAHSHDSSNAKIDKYSRNFIRHEILPLMEQVHSGATQKIADIANEAFALESFAATELQKKISRFDGKVPASFLINLDETLAMLAIRLMITELCVASRLPQLSKGIFRSVLERLKRNEDSEKKWCFDLPGALVFSFNNGYVEVSNSKQEQKTIRSSQHKRRLETDEVQAILPANSQLDVYFQNRSDQQKILENKTASHRLCCLSIREPGSISRLGDNNG